MMAVDVGCGRSREAPCEAQGGVWTSGSDYDGAVSTCGCLQLVVLKTGEMNPSGERNRSGFIIPPMTRISNEIKTIRPYWPVKEQSGTLSAQRVAFINVYR